MKRALWIACVLELAAAQAVLAFLLRDTADSLWPDKPVQIDGRAAEWPATPKLEEEGLSFQAMNDASNLYLLIRGTNNDGRMVLSGRFRQNVTLWFVKSDQTSRAWGINLNYSHAHSSEESPIHGDASQTIIPLSAMGVVPELVIPQGLQLSTATLPSEIQVQADLSHKNDRQPVCEIAIPLKMIEHRGMSIDMDFVTSQVAPGAMAQSQSDRSSSSEGGEGSTGQSKGGHHHHGGGSQGGGTRSIEPPNPLDLHLEIALNQKSKP